MTKIRMMIQMKNKKMVKIRIYLSPPNVLLMLAYQDISWSSLRNREELTQRQSSSVHFLL